MDNVTTAFTYSLFGKKSLAQACQRSLMWTKLLQQNWSLFLSFSVLFLTCIESGHLCRQNLLSLGFADTSSNLCARGTSTCMIHTGCGSGCWFELTARCSLPGKAIACYFGRELIVLIAAWSSFAPRPVPENRCVTCHILNRWTYHMPLKVVIQLSLTLWVNSSSLLHQSLNRQKKC